VAPTTSETAAGAASDVADAPEAAGGSSAAQGADSPENTAPGLRAGVPAGTATADHTVPSCRGGTGCGTAP
jgi:hypothetical protein